MRRFAFFVGLAVLVFLSLPIPQNPLAAVAQESPSPAFTSFFTPFVQTTMKPAIPSTDEPTSTPAPEPSPTAT